MPKINKIKLSGTSYDIQDSNASKTVTLTQAQYDALADKDPNTFYIISDGEMFNPSGKVDTSAFTAYSASVETALSGKASESDLNTLSSTVTGHTADTTIHVTANEKSTWNAKSDFSGDYNDLTNKLSAGTNITIVDNVISATGGGGKAVSGGTNISITTGETADTINCTLPISAGTNVLGVVANAIKMGENTTASSVCSFAMGTNTFASGYRSFAGGVASRARAECTFAYGTYVDSLQFNETAFGRYNVSNKANTTWGDSGNTLFSVGNGTADNARHNAFEVRQNGDIYLTLDGQDVKLQDQLGGSYVTTDTEQIISGRKTFINSDKAIEFKQFNDSSKVGFKVKNSASTNNELASFEFRPNTFTIDNVQHPLMYFGHYRKTSIANAGVPQTVIGFRQYDQLNAAAYHYLIPLPEKAKTPFSLTTSFKDYYAPMGFKNGSTMITADDTGVVDLSSELGGLKLVKLTQAEYDALATKDSNTLYVIVN